jgi:hypothetical protein
MALTPQEQEELAQLESELGNSVFNPNRPQPTFLQEFGQAAVETLPELGGMVGGVGGFLLGRNPVTARGGAALGSAAVRGMLGAGLGGATGEAAQQAITGRPSLMGLVRSGLEQAIYDGAGNLIFSYGGKAFRFTKQEISKRFGGQVPEDAVAAAQKLLQEEGATLTPFQATGDSWAGFKESVARGSFTGKPTFEKAAQKTETALMSAKNKILDDISDRVYDSVKTGEEFATAIAKGDEALKTTVRPFYEAMTQQTRTVPVDIVPIQVEASRVLNAADKAGGLTLSANERTYLDQVTRLPEKIDFATSHEIVSSLKTRLRDLKNSAEPDTATVARLTKIVGSLEKQMDVAGRQVTGPALQFEGKIGADTATTLADQYKFYSQLYRESIKDLYSDTTTKLLNKDPEFVGKTIFRTGNVTAFDEFKAALERAKKLNPELNVGQTVQSVQRGYLESLLKSEGRFSTLGDKLVNDTATRETFEKILNKEQQKRVKTLLDAAKLSETTPSATAPLFFAAQQAQATGTVLSLGALAFSDEARGTVASNPFWSSVAAGTLLLGPRFWAKAALNPETTNAALGFIKAQQNNNVTKNLLLKTAQVFEKAGIAPEDMTAQSEVKEQPVGLTPEEQAELDALEQELGK